MGRLLWPEEVAELAGIEHRSVIHNASQHRRHKRAEERQGLEAGTLTRYDMPLPVAHTRRVVQTQGGEDRTVNSPQWDEDEINAWRALLETRPAPDRARDGKSGRYLKAAS